MRILVIEDDPVLLELLKRILARAGYQVSGAANGEVGLALFRAAPTDVVVTDIIHPWCDGDQGPITCEKGVSRQLQEALENEIKRNEELKRTKSNLESASSQTSDEQEKTRLEAEEEATDNAIYDSNKAIDEFKDNLKKREDFVDKAIYTINKCIDYRRAVMNVFATALDKVRNESEDEIKPLALELRNAYEKSKRGHEIAITDKENAILNCKEEEL